MAERTEAPTQKRLDEARRRGQVAKSVEVNTALVLLAAFLAMGSLVQRVGTELAAIARSCFGGLSTGAELAEAGATGLFAGALDVLLRLTQAMAPFVGILVVVGVVANVGQSGLLLSFESLKPTFSKVNPITGLKRLFSTRGVVDLVKAVLKIALVSYVAYEAINKAFPSLLDIPRDELGYFLHSWQGAALGLAKKASITLLVIAAADYAVQRWQWMQGLRMTKQELREEMRQATGDPMLKGRLRQRQRQFAMNRMMADVPKADVVVTNPTHIAVALRYEPKKASAPVVVAKGERLIAEKIKEVARTHGVPLVENKPLARAMFKSVDIGGEIPVQLYDAVAGVLAFVFSLKSRGHA